MSDGGTVLLLDDDAGFRMAVEWLIGAQGMRVRSYASASHMFAAEEPLVQGCCLVDLRLRDGDGVDVVTAARQRGFDLPMILVSAYGTIPAAVRAMEQGAYDFIEKPIDNERLLTTVRRACVDHRQSIAAHGRALPAVTAYDSLTARERDVFWQLVAGNSCKQIGQTLGISHRTAEVHRLRVLAKFGGAGSADLIRAAHHLRPNRMKTTSG